MKKQDRRAFIKTYDTYASDIYRFIFFKVSDDEEARDLTSKTFLKAWDHLQSRKVKDQSSLKSFLYRIARNLVIDHYREKSRNSAKEIKGDENLPEVEDSRQDLQKKTEVASDMEVVQKKMQKLKSEYREVLVLRYINELSISEIAGLLEKSQGSIRVMIHRALRALKELMQEDGENSQSS